MFKNIIIYRVAPNSELHSDAIEQALKKHQFAPTGATQQKSAGFVPPRGEAHGALLEAVDGQYIAKLQTEVRQVPGPVIKRRVDEIAEQMEQQTGRKPGKKIMKELKEQALQELLPSAFTKLASDLVWLDQKARLLIVDSSSMTRAEEVVTLLIKALDGLALTLVQTDMSPAVAMTHWLGTGEPPYQFTIDRECELKSTDEMKSVVKYGRHDLDTDEVRQHIASGKVPTRVAMTWRDRVSFTMTESMVLKKVAFLDVVFEAKVAGQAEKGEAFDADVAISTGELAELIPDLFNALGGEQVMQLGAQAPQPVQSTAPTESSESSDGMPDPLYPDAAKIVVANQRASISLVQRHLRIGYNRAARLLEQMERAGLISPMKPDGSREINDLVNMANREEEATPWDA